MVDAASRLETMRDMFLYSNRLYSWCLTPDTQMLYTNCPSPQFFYNLFISSPCAANCINHLKADTAPVLLADQVGFAWIAAGQFDGEALTAIHLLGPMFTVEANESYLRSLCGKMKLSNVLLDELLNQLSLVPVVLLNIAIHYAIMMHYCVTGLQIDANKITFINAGIPDASENQWENTSYHGTWETEQQMLRMIRDGSMDNMAEIAQRFGAGRVGTMCPDDPLRQAKDEMICFAVLCSRAAIQGGVSPEGGYNIADYYIQRAETAKSVTAVQNCISEMLQTAVARVRQCKTNSRYSAPIASCMEYIETHILEKIQLDAMAREIGYASYYLSGKFQKETGMSISSYIKQKKVELAKTMLGSSSISAVEVSEQLSFSSPSYFGSVFRQYTGMTPNEYQNKSMKA